MFLYAGMTKILVLALNYTLGSINTASILAKALKLPSPRKTGSNNPGATNMLRNNGKINACLTFIGDFTKSLLAVHIAKKMQCFTELEIAYLAIAIVLGNNYSIFLNFKGGKGVSTFIGIVFAISKISGVIIIFTWLTILVKTKYASLASLIVTVVTPIIVVYMKNCEMLTPFIILSITINIKHIVNYKRLIIGKEVKSL